jgi:hypothetical protein
MSKTMTLKPKGLYTYYNSLADVNEGALLKADNIVIQQEGVAQPRRGIKYWSNSFGSNDVRARQLFEYKSRIFCHYLNTLAFDSTGSGSFTPFSGTYNSPLSDTRIKGLEYKGNFYFTSDSGIKKISAKTVSDINASSVVNSGVPVALDGVGTAKLPAIGFLDSNYQCVYKVTWAYLDNNNLLVEGAPSDDIVVENKTAQNSLYVDLSITIPSEIQSTDYIFRVYRSTSVTLTSTPEREFNLVFEGNPTSSEISAKKLTYTDTLSEDFRSAGLPLYTNAVSGGGALSANYAPPYAVDMALFNNHVFYANTKLAHFKEYSFQSIQNLYQKTLTITDGTTSNVYYFNGATEENTVKMENKSFIPADFTYFLLTSANIERQYYVALNKTGIIPSTNLENDGRILINVNISAVSAPSDIATLVANAINSGSNGDFIAVTEDVNGIHHTLPIELTLNTYVRITNTKNGYDRTVDDNGTTISPYGLTDSTLAPTQFIFTHKISGIGESLTTNPITVLWSSQADLLGVEETAKSFVRMINSNSNEIVTAYYISGTSDTPGKILLRRKDFLSLPFYMSTNSNAAKTDIYPNIPLNSDPVNLKKYGSEDQAALNSIYISKPDQPESVPLANVVLVGSSDAPILRIMALRESLFIFKKDGIFRLNGDDVANFSVNLFDSTAIVKVPDSLAVLTNEIYYFGTQGIAKLSEVGNTVISVPIQDKVLPLISSAPNLATASFGISYETDRSYMIWTLLSKEDTVAQVAYRFNVETSTWVEWKIPKTCAVLNSKEDKLYFGSSSANLVEVERKTFSRFDYADREIQVELPYSAFYGNVIRPSGSSNFDIGDIVIQTQYLTINRFNQVLSMLDKDINMGTPDWISNFEAFSGDSLTAKLGLLVPQLDARDSSGFLDSNGYTSYSAIFTGSEDFQVLFSEWNKIVQRLNESHVPNYENYPIYDFPIPVEAQVENKDSLTGSITLDFSLPFIVGPMLLYKAINSEIEYVPQHGGDPMGFKQFSTAQATFQYRSFHFVKLGFNSDLSTDFEYVDFTPNAYSVYGNDFFGTGSVWGGLGDKGPLRTFIPRKKQRSKFLGARILHFGALESYQLYGVTITYRIYEVEDRAYR